MKVKKQIKALGVLAPMMAVGIADKVMAKGSGTAGSYVSTVGSGQNDTSIMETVQSVISVVVGLVGLVAVVMIILGGFQYTTSAGDTNKVTKAKNTILYGIIGLVIAILAFAIVNFVLQNI